MSLMNSDPMSKRETLELVRAYYGIQDPEARRRLFELARFVERDLINPTPIFGLDRVATV